MKIKRIAAAALAFLMAVSAAGCTPEYKEGEGFNSEQYYKDVDKKLINPNADECAVKLYNFLTGIYGKKTLSGQYINEYENYSEARFRADESDPNSPPTVFKALELRAVNSVTGEYPAVLGVDFSEVERGKMRYSAEQAIEWHNAGGIVTSCWHWIAPSQNEEKQHFYTKNTDFNLKKALADKESPEYKGLIADIDAVSAELKKLSDAGVPVLWRPMHEASGGWFWWGASGAKAYKELWDIMYDRMTNYHGLNNLIWVCNAQSPKWYVGDDKCDIIGDDPYYPSSKRSAYEKNPANYGRFKKCYKTTSKKMIAMTENDYVPGIDEMYESNARWLMFSTWCMDFVCKPSSNPDTPWAFTPEYNEKCSTREELAAVYSNENVLTLKKLNESGEYR